MKHETKPTLGGGVNQTQPMLGRDRRVGPYFLQHQIGSGGMAAVYQAVRVDTGALVALKIVLLGDNERARQRFRLEAEALTRLRHAHIAPVIDIGSEGSLDYIAMKLIQGEPIDQWVREHQPSWPQLAEIAANIADAMAEAHKAGVVHRDIKPGNVLVDQRGYPYLLDFGIARDLNADHGLTATEEAVGTPAFMAPEQAQNNPDQIGPGCDIWSLGVLLYYLSTDHLPFVGNTVYQIYEEILYQTPRKPRSYRPELPSQLERIILSCLRKEINQRYLSAEDLSDDLKRFARGELVQARRWFVSSQQVWQNDLWVMLVGMLLAAIGFVIPVIGKWILLGAVAWLLGAHMWWWRSRSSHQRERVDLAQRRMREQVRAAAPTAQREINWQGTPLYQSEEGLNGWKVTGGKVEATEQGIILKGGRPLELVSPLRVAGDQRIDIQIDSIEPGESWGLSFASMNGRPQSGYSLFFDRQRSRIALFRAGIRLWQQLVPRDEWRSNHHCVVTLQHSSIEIVSEGVTLVQINDPRPLIGDKICLFNSVGSVLISQCTIYQEQFGYRVDALSLADRLTSLGQVKSALDMLQLIPADVDNDVAAHRLEQVQQRARRRERQERRFVEWRDQITQQWPEALVEPGVDGLTCDVSAAGDAVTSFVPLQGIPISQLYASGTAVSKIHPLSELPLQKLDLSRTQVTSVKSLRGLPLNDLRLDHCPLTSLSGLVGLPLRSLSLQGCF